MAYVKKVKVNYAIQAIDDFNTAEFTNNELAKDFGTSVITSIKLSFCQYIAALFLKAPSEKEINLRLDKIINHKMENMIQGDKDLKTVVLYVINWRKLERNLINKTPNLSSNIFIKAIMKSLFT